MSIRVIKTPLKGITRRLINGYISPSNNSLWLVCEYLSGNKDGNGKRLEGIPTAFYAKTAYQQQADREESSSSMMTQVGMMCIAC